VAQPRTVIIGAGIGGLTSAALLARAGHAVTVCEAASVPGGKAHAENGIDAGPTVFTKRDIFEALFDACGASLADHVRLTPATTLARHSWGGEARLDLFADAHASEDAIATFAGPAEARGYARFRAAAKRAHDTLDASFMRAPATSPFGLAARIGLARLPDMVAIRPMARLWPMLGRYFTDPRLRQLFGRYATYCGSSPFEASATLMLIAHVEATGVWLIEGGLSALAGAIEALATGQGARFRYDAPVASVVVKAGRAAGVVLANGERIDADQVIVNADPAALASGRFGEAVRRAVPGYPAARRSLSAVTFLGSVEASGFPLAHHNVFFSSDYAREFAEIANGAAPTEPTVYLCAQDRGASATAITGPERIQIIVNAPANGDTHHWSEQEADTCRTQMLETLARSGLRLAGLLHATTPTDFARRYPATGGALYGMASHGWAASFRRPGSRTRIPGLYCAGGGTHPGAGVPMAALSGHLAAACLIADRASTRSFHPVAMAGGMSTRSVSTIASG